MKGHYKKRGCKCPANNCTCGRTWSFVVDVGKDLLTGERNREYGSGFKTREDAETAVATLLMEIKRGTFIKESDILFKDWANDWLPFYIERNGPKSSTVRLRLYSTRKLYTYFAHLKLKSISEEMYQSALNDLKDKGLSRSTIEGVHTTAKMIFKMAVSKKLIKADPTQNAYIKKDPQVIIETDEEELPNFFEKEDLALFLKTVKEKGLFQDEAFFITLSYTGIRIGELVALKWSDIDFKNQTIRITKTYNNDTNNIRKYKLEPPKTKKSRRKIFVDELVINTLLKHKEAQNKMIQRFGNSYYDQGFVFTNVNKYPGYPVLIKFVEDRMGRLLKKMDSNQRLTPHSLRHTHTSLLAEAGVGLEEIMDRLGHQDDEVTRKVYLHVTQTLKKEASEKFSNLMNSLI